MSPLSLILMIAFAVLFILYKDQQRRADSYAKILSSNTPLWEETEPEEVIIALNRHGVKYTFFIKPTEVPQVDIEMYHHSRKEWAPIEDSKYIVATDPDRALWVGDPPRLNRRMREDREPAMGEEDE